MAVESEDPGYCWPNARQTLFLRACLADGDAARDAWAEFRSGYDFDRADGHEQFLAPLLARNLDRLGVDEPLLGRLRGLRRYHWLRNQALTRHGAKAIALLEAAGIDAMTLKGGAMFAAYYDDLGLRPMADFDLAVRQAQASAAAKLLVEHGWKPAFNASLDFVANGAIPLSHAWTFVGPGGIEVDLHWHVASQVRSDAFAAELWNSAAVGTLYGQKILVPAPEHLLLITILHGLRWTSPGNLRWVADTVEILARRGDAIDPHKVVRAAELLRMIVAVRAALDYIDRDLGISPQPALLAAVRRRRRPLIERWALETELQHPVHRTPIGLSAMAYQVRARERGGRRRPGLSAMTAILRRALVRDTKVALSDRFVTAWTRKLPPLPLAPGTRLGFGLADGIPAVPGAGWYLSESRARWSDHPMAEIRFQWNGPLGAPIPLELHGSPLLYGTRRAVNVTLSANGKAFVTKCFRIGDDLAQPWRVDVPSETVGPDRALDLLIAVENPTSPAALGMSGDYRILSYFLANISSPERLSA